MRTTDRARRSSLGIVGTWQRFAGPLCIRTRLTRWRCTLPGKPLLETQNYIISGCSAQLRPKPFLSRTAVLKEEAASVATKCFRGSGIPNFGNLDVAVVGGGPAGLAVALALLRVQPGLKLKVFEASPGYSRQGAGVTLQLSGARALEALDPSITQRLLQDAVLLAVHRQYNDETGEAVPWYKGLDHMKDFQESGFVTCLAPWNSLRTVLSAYLPEGTIEFGCKVVRCTGPQPEDMEADAAAAAVSEGATATSPDVAETREDARPRYTLTVQQTSRNGAAGGPREVVARARYVIAADGYFSRIRRTAGDGKVPTFLNTVRWLANLTEADLLGGQVPVPAALDPKLNPLALSTFHSWNPTSVEKPLAGPPHRSLNVYAVAHSEETGVQLVWSMMAPVGALEAAGEAFPMMAPVGALEAAGEAFPMMAPVGAPGGEAPGAVRGTESRGEVFSGVGDAGRLSVHDQQGHRRGARALQRALAASVHLPPDVRAMLAATPPERVMEFGLYKHAQDTFEQGAWTQGGVVLVGDAAHVAPPGGQGASLAFEDAAVLGAMIRHHGLGPKAFEAWEEARMSAVKALRPNDPQGISTGRAASFEPLWCPVALSAPGGPLPEPVAAEVREALAKGESIDKAREVLLRWSRDAMRRILEAKVRGMARVETVDPPAGAYRF